MRFKHEEDRRSPLIQRKRGGVVLTASLWGEEPTNLKFFGRENPQEGGIRKIAIWQGKDS